MPDKVLPVSQSDLAVEAPDDGPGWEGVWHFLGLPKTFLILVAATAEQGRVLEESFFLLKVFPTAKAEDLLVAGHFEMSSLVLLQRAAVSKLSLAELALIWFFSCMNPLMLLQV